MATELLETALGYEITAGAPVYPTEVYQYSNQYLD